MIGLYLGGVEISEGISVDRKVTLTAGAVANLVGAERDAVDGDMTNMLNAATTIMAPYSTSPLKITVSCINIDANKVAKVKWSVTQQRHHASRRQPSRCRPRLQVANTQLLFSEVSYAYTPTVGHVITGTLNLSDTMYMARASARRSITAPPAPDHFLSAAFASLIGSAVVDLIRSIAKRDVTFLSGTVAISFL